MSERSLSSCVKSVFKAVAHLVATNSKLPKNVSDNPQSLSDFQLKLLSNVRTAYDSISNDTSVFLRDEVKAALAVDSNLCVSKQFLTLSYELLRLLKDALVALRQLPPMQSSSEVPHLPADSLSVREEQNLRSLIQFVVAVGIAPHLLSGVGLPKSSLSKQIEDVRQECGGSSTKELRASVRELFVCFEHATLLSALLTCHLADVLAAVMQLCFSPRPNAGEDEASALKAEATSQLQHLMDAARPEELVKQLMRLQSVSRQCGKGSGLQWMQVACGRLLSSVVMRPEGVYHTIQGMFDTIPGGDESHGDWHKCMMLAQLLSRCPQQARSAEDYYEAVIPQLLSLLSTPAGNGSLPFQRVASLAFHAMLQSPSPACSGAAVDHLFGPILCLVEEDRASCQPVVATVPSGDVIACEATVERCIQNLHQMFVETVVPHSTMAKSSVHHLEGAALSLFSLATFMGKSTLAVREMCLAVLDILLHHSAQPVMTLLIFVHPRPALINSCRWAHGSGGGPVVVRAVGNSELPWPPALEDRITVLLELLDVLNAESTLVSKKSTQQALSCGTEAIPTAFIRTCLERLTSSLEDDDLIREEKEAFLGAGVDVRDKEVLHLEMDLVLLHMLALVCERLGPKNLPPAGVLLRFAKASLCSVARVLEADQGEVRNKQEDGMITCSAAAWSVDTVSLTLAFLSELLGGEVELPHGERPALLALVPFLERLAQLHPDAGIRILLGEMHIAVATQQAMFLSDGSGSASDLLQSLAKQLLKAESGNCEESQKAKGKNSQPASPGPDRTLLEGREELHRQPVLVGGKDSFIRSNHSVSEEQSVCTHQTKSDISPDVKKEGKTSMKGRLLIEEVSALSEKESSVRDTEAYMAAMEELCDPLLPVRGHALQALSRLLRERDRSALRHADELTGVFCEQLSHPDTYIYLAAVNGLVALGDVRTPLAVPRLCQEFAAAAKDKFRAGEVRLKLCEALSKVARLCGALLPHYRRLFLNTLLSGVRDDDGLVRAACLSALADVCRLLRYSLGESINEIINCLLSVLKTDRCHEPRRAAAFALEEMFAGLESSLVQVLSSNLRPTYSQLKLAADSDPDELVRVRASAALGHLDDIIRKQLFTQPSLTKTIHVLRPPT